MALRLRNWDSEEVRVSTDRIEEPFAFCGAISNGVCYIVNVECWGR